MSKGMPLLPLYTRGAGLHDGVLVGLQGRSPSWLQLYLLCLRKAGFYPYSDGSFMKSCAASSPSVSRLESSARPTPCPSGRIGPSMWIPGVTSSTVAPERFAVELQHIV